MGRGSGGGAGAGGRVRAEAGGEVASAGAREKVRVGGPHGTDRFVVERDRLPTQAELVRVDRKKKPDHSSKEGLVVRVPIEAIASVATRPPDPGRTAGVEKARDEGAKIAPPRISVGSDGTVNITDGNHRIIVARKRGDKYITVQVVAGI